MWGVGAIAATAWRRRPTPLTLHAQNVTNLIQRQKLGYQEGGDQDKRGRTKATEDKQSQMKSIIFVWLRFPSLGFVNIGTFFLGTLTLSLINATMAAERKGSPYKIEALTPTTGRSDEPDRISKILQGRFDISIES